MKFYSFDEWLVENAALSGSRDWRKKINLTHIKYVYHWLTEGNLFEQIYGGFKYVPNHQSFILRKTDGKKIEMPPLPPHRYILGGESTGPDTERVCMTVDPTYDRAGESGESKVCLVLDLQRILKEMQVTDLTDNHEAEIRVQKIDNWPDYCSMIFIDKKTYEKGDGWEGFFYRAVQEWLPQELKTKVKVMTSTKAICKELEKLK